MLKIENSTVTNRIKNSVEEILALEAVEKITSEEFENFLNNMVNEEKCKEIIKGFKGKIQDISKINNTKLWEVLLEEERVIIDLDNILKYNEHYYIDENSVKIVDANINKIVLDLKEGKNDKDKIKEFLLEIVMLNGVKDTNILTLLECCEWFKIEKCEFENINKNRIIMLINGNYILFNKENYNFVKAETVENLYEFCKNNISEFVEIYDDLEVEKNLAEQLAFSDILEEYQLILFEKLEYDVIYKNVNDANTFLKIINRDDSNYKNYFDFIRTRAFFEMSNIEDIKIKCFIKYLDKISKEDAHSLLETFRNEEYKKISNNIDERPAPFSEEDEIVELIKKLRNRGYIIARYYANYKKYYIQK